MLTLRNTSRSLLLNLTAGISLSLSSLLHVPHTHAAPIPPADKIFPQSTVGIASIPDYKKTAAHSENEAWFQFFRDPAMKPFIEKFKAKWQSDVVAPLEKEFSIKLDDYKDLAQGQVSIAWLRPPEDGKSDVQIPFLFVLDSGEKSEALKKALEDLRKKWVDSGKQIRPEKIRDVEFTTYLFTSQDVDKSLKKAFPSDEEPDDKDPKGKDADKSKAGDDDNADGDKKISKYAWLVGQSDSALVIGNSVPDIERLLSQMGGNASASLGETPHFQSYKDSLFQGVDFLGWIHTHEIIDFLIKSQPKPRAGRRGEAPPDMGQILEGFGIRSIQALAMASRTLDDGQMLDVRIKIPEGERTGITQILQFGAKDASPPAFVPADVVSFNRTRLDLMKSFETLESTLIKVFPQSASLIKLMMDTAGKDKDPNFDLRKSLFGNLGDDIINYSKAPREAKLETINNTPSLFLLGSRDSDQLVSAIKVLTGFLPTQGGKPKEREFLGRKVFTIDMPGNDKGLSLTASGGYLVVSDDDAMLEEYLRSAEQKPKALAEIPGLAEESQKVKGMNQGMFSYNNVQQDIRVQFELLKKEGGSLADLIAGTAIGNRLGLDEDSKKISEWLDFSLLPAFDQVSHYFYRTLTSGSFSPDGFELRAFNPVPPKLRK